jgi:hypothetical protein
MGSSGRNRRSTGDTPTARSTSGPSRRTLKRGKVKGHTSPAIVVAVGTNPIYLDVIFVRHIV